MSTTTPTETADLNSWLDQRLAESRPETLRDLEELVADVGRASWLWSHDIRFDQLRKSHQVLYEAPTVKIALFGWVAGQDTTFHDHGGASGAAFVCSGALLEDTIEAVDAHVVRERSFVRPAESSFSFGPDYIHRVRQDPAQGICMSIHAYTPAVAESVDYEIAGDGRSSASRFRRHGGA